MFMSSSHFWGVFLFFFLGGRWGVGEGVNAQEHVLVVFHNLSLLDNKFNKNVASQLE